MSMIETNFGHYAARRQRVDAKRRRLQMGTPTVVEEMLLLADSIDSTEPFAAPPRTQFCWIHMRREPFSFT